MSLIRKHVAVLQAWACLDLVIYVSDVRVCKVYQSRASRPASTEYALRHSGMYTCMIGCYSVFTHSGWNWFCICLFVRERQC